MKLFSVKTDEVRPLLDFSYYSSFSQHLIHRPTAIPRYCTIFASDPGIWSPRISMSKRSQILYSCHCYVFVEEIMDTVWPTSRNSRRGSSEDSGRSSDKFHCLSLETRLQATPLNYTITSARHDRL